jgi:hypothetical protein
MTLSDVKAMDLDVISPDIVAQVLRCKLHPRCGKTAACTIGISGYHYRKSREDPASWVYPVYGGDDK